MKKQELERLEKELSLLLEKDSKVEIAKKQNEIAVYYISISETKTALRYCTESLKISEEIGDKNGIATSFNNIGEIYDSKGDYKTAKEYFEKSLKISEEIGDKNGIATSFNNIGGIYNSKGDIKTALEYYEKSLKIKEEIADKKGIATSFNNIGIIYKSKGDIKTALEYYEKSLKISEEIADKSGIATSFNNIGGIYYERKEIKLSLIYLFKSYVLLKQMQHFGLKNTIVWINTIIKHLGEEIYLHFAKLAYEELESEYKKEIDINEFLPKTTASVPKYDRNQTVKVKYLDGTIVETKYKKIESDLINGNCEIYDESEIVDKLASLEKELNLLLAKDSKFEPAKKQNEIAEYCLSKKESEKALYYYVASLKIYINLYNTSDIINVFTKIGNIFINHADNNFRFLFFTNKEETEYCFQFWQGTDLKNKIPNLCLLIKKDFSCSFEISSEDDQTKASFFEQITKKLGGYIQQKKEGVQINKWIKEFEKSDLSENIKDFFETDKKIIDILLSFRLENDFYNNEKFNGLRFISETEFNEHLNKPNIKIEKPNVTGKVLLKSLELNNITRFESIKIKFDKQVTCIIAENGVGKSTILSSIALAIAGVDANSIMKNVDIKNKLRILNYDKIPHYSKSGFIDLEYEIDKIYINKIDFEFLNNIQGIKVTDSTENFDSFAINRKDDGNYFNQLIIGFPQAQNLYDYDKKKYGLLEDTAPNIKDILPLITEQFDENLTRSFSDWLDLVYKTSNKKDEIISNIFGIISQITGDKVALKEINYTEDNKPIIIITKKESPNGIPLSMVSQGLSNIFVWIGQIIKRIYQSNPDLKELKDVNAVIMIDEIDKYLHPKWQSQILKVLLDEFKNCQFIVTTHSAIVLDGLEKGQIAYIKNIDGKPEVIYNDSPIWGWHYQEILKKFMEVYHDFSEYDIFEIEDEIKELKSNNADKELIKRKEKYLEKVKDSKKARDINYKLKESLMAKEIELQKLIEKYKK